MSAPTHTRSLPSRHGAGPAARAGAADARLPWWALALPALAFGLLLLLLAGSGEAHAASGEASGLLQVSRQILRAIG
ncbi:hypothetical protein [Streptomyces sp. ISL-94]|uniref:hypothetical protein n=1 Tax=Streptomyces sp. ISL-94 TaxID=2819190 RepID=UPI001BE6772F|nr:hypothetical protein [Streptomyces sp. ISL-94]MBT2476986.1 hypothetical protein [Streptomyces sp. ISL-94]